MHLLSRVAQVAPTFFGKAAERDLNLQVTHKRAFASAASHQTDLGRIPLETRKKSKEREQPSKRDKKLTL